MPRGKDSQNRDAAMKTPRPSERPSPVVGATLIKGLTFREAGTATRRLPPGDWQDKARQFFRDRGEQRRRAKGRRSSRDVEKPRVFLECGAGIGKPFPLSPTGDPEIDFGPRDVGGAVRNNGNFPSLNCHVQILEGPAKGSLSDYVVRLEQVIAVGPGEIVYFKFPLKREKFGNVFKGFSYDPIYFPLKAAEANFDKPFKPPLPPVKIG